MKKIISTTLLALFLSAGLVGCNEKEPIDYNLGLSNCKQDTARERAEFILACVKNANPHSDEEPEDWMRECQIMAEETLCETATFKVTMVYKLGSWVEEKRQMIAPN